ncbi:MAG TPA: hypothetical protein VN902_03080 [Candidatus Acidoferrales bacterium]|nr:hypothetical protein [Candidatus Acidoferrales bacterium]
MEKVIVHRTYWGYGDFVYGPSDDRPDNTPDDIPTIVEKVRERAPVDAALAKSSGMDVSRSWLEVLTDDLDDDTGPLDTGLMVVKTGPVSTLGKQARPAIAKTATRTDADGFTWVETFDSTGALLETRVLLSAK